MPVRPSGSELSPTRTKVCRVDELPAGASRIFELPDLSVGVFNVDDRFFAVRNRCPHRGAPLCAGRHSGTMLPSERGVYEYGLEEYVLACPWHAREFDIRDGRSLLPGDRTRVGTYEVAVEDGYIVVDVSRSLS
jgi:3-phenylpropionate/trans-cinnamate dioxygenase ferredoxin subunit